MRNAFQLRIITPTRLMLDEEVREVIALGTLGEFGVLPDHITFLTSLEIGAMSYRTDRGITRLAVRGGFAEVVDNVMTVLAQNAVFPEDIDTVATRADLQAAEAQLHDLSPTDAAYGPAEANRLWAEARIAVAAGR